MSDKRTEIVYGPKIQKVEHSHIIRDELVDFSKWDEAFEGLKKSIEKLEAQMTRREKIHRWFRSNVNRILNFMEALGNIFRGNK